MMAWVWGLEEQAEPTPFWPGTARCGGCRHPWWSCS